VSGEVIDINQAAADAPESINADAYGAWLFRIKPAGAAELATQLGALLDAAAYDATL
jgi:glycine cleavage system H protein